MVGGTCLWVSNEDQRKASKTLVTTIQVLVDGYKAAI